MCSRTKVADDEVGAAIFHRPYLREVGFDEGDVRRLHLFPRPGEHAGGKVEGSDLVADLDQKDRVFAGAAAGFDDAAKVLAGQGAEVTCWSRSRVRLRSSS